MFSVSLFVSPEAAGYERRLEERNMLEDTEDRLREEELRQWEEEFDKFNKMLELCEMRERENDVRVREALAKFNFFIHTTGWLSGTAYLVIMGILVPGAWPWLAIPIGIWAFLLLVHALYAFWPSGPVNRFLKKVFRQRKKRRSRSGKGPDKEESDETQEDEPDRDDDDGCDPGFTG